MDLLYYFIQFKSTSQIMICCDIPIQLINIALSFTIWVTNAVMLPCSFCSLGSVGDWISTEGAPCVCPRYSCNSSGKTKVSYSRAVLILYIQVSNVKKHTGNLDCVSLCCSCFNGDIPLLATPLLYLVLLKLCSTRRFNRSYQFCKLGKFQIFFLLNYILDGSYSHC